MRRRGCLGRKKEMWMCVERRGAVDLGMWRGGARGAWQEDTGRDGYGHACLCICVHKKNAGPHRIWNKREWNRVVTRRTRRSKHTRRNGNRNNNLAFASAEVLILYEHAGTELK